MNHKVIIVGSGPAGIGVGVLLRKMNINFFLLKKEQFFYRIMMSQPKPQDYFSLVRK